MRKVRASVGLAGHWRMSGGLELSDISRGFWGVYWQRVGSETVVLQCVT